MSTPKVKPADEMDTEDKPVCDTRTQETIGWRCLKCGQHMLHHTFGRGGGRPICPT